MQNQQKERRSAPRLTRRERLVIRPFTPKSGAYMTTIYCSTVDISPQGLQVQLDYTLPVGHVLDLSVKLEREQQRFKLAGEIRWVNKMTTGDAYRLGLLLRERGCTDIKRWRRLFTRRQLPAQRPAYAALHPEMLGL
jgi:Tfp pilus assembly protein PilZ